MCWKIEKIEINNQKIIYVNKKSFKKWKKREEIEMVELKECQRENVITLKNAAMVQLKKRHRNSLKNAVKVVKNRSRNLKTELNDLNGSLLQLEKEQKKIDLNKPNKSILELEDLIGKINPLNSQIDNELKSKNLFKKIRTKFSNSINEAQQNLQELKNKRKDLEEKIQKTFDECASKSATLSTKRKLIKEKIRVISEKLSGPWATHFDRIQVVDELNTSFGNKGPEIANQNAAINHQIKKLISPSNPLSDKDRILSEKVEKLSPKMDQDISANLCPELARILKTMLISLKLDDLDPESPWNETAKGHFTLKLKNPINIWINADDDGLQKGKGVVHTLGDKNTNTIEFVLKGKKLDFQSGNTNTYRWKQWPLKGQGTAIINGIDFKENDSIKIRTHFTASFLTDVPKTNECSLKKYLKLWKDAEVLKKNITPESYLEKK